MLLEPYTVYIKPCVAGTVYILFILTLVLLEPYTVYINPCVAGTVYKRFQASFRPNKISLVCDKCSNNQRIKLCKCLFFIKSHIFRHLKLEIALTIPASMTKNCNKQKIQQLMG